MKLRVWLLLILASGAIWIWTGSQKLQYLEEAEHLQDIVLANEDISALLHAAAKNREVILMAVTWGYRDFLLNSICRLEQLDIHHFVILALDDDTHKFFSGKGFSVVRSTALGTRKRYGNFARSLYSREFNFIAREKHAGALACILLGLKVLLLDVDVFLIKDPLVILRNASDDFDFVFQSDAKLSDSPNFYINSGFYYARPSSGTITTLSRLLSETHDGYNQEQTVLHNLVCGVDEKFALSSSSCYNPDTKSASTVLDRHHFVHGYTLTRDANAKQVLAWDPFSLHFNWLEGKSNKLSAMEALGMWIAEHNNCSHTYNVGNSLTLAETFDTLVSVV